MRGSWNVLYRHVNLELELEVHGKLWESRAEAPPSVREVGVRTVMMVM